MSGSIVKYLNPWKLRRERQAERLAALRARDGDQCARCRRPLRFDLPAGHDQGFTVEHVARRAASGRDALGDLRLCHPRCNPAGVDHTGEVLHRARLKNEVALFEKAKKKRKKAA